MINLDESDKENLLNECKIIYYLTICFLAQMYHYKNLHPRYGPSRFTTNIIYFRVENKNVKH